MLIIASFSSSAQIQVSPDVNKALQAALAKDVVIQNNDLELQKMEHERQAVLHKYLPTLGFSSMYSYFSNTATLNQPGITLPILNTTLAGGKEAVDLSGNFFHAGLTAKAILFSGGQILNGAKALEQKNTGTAFLLESQKDSVVRNVLGSFDQLALIKEAEKLIEESRIRLTKEQERVDRAVKSGLAIPFDRDKIKLATLELESKSNDLENKKQLLALKLSQDTQIPIADILTLKHYAAPIFIAEKPSMQQKSEISALLSFQKATEFQLKKERGSFLPSLGAFGGYTYTSLFNTSTSTYSDLLQKDLSFKINSFTLSPNFIVGVGLKWDIFSGLERADKIKEIRLSQQQLNNKLRDAKEKLNLLLDKNWINYQYQNAQLKVAGQRGQIASNNVILAEKQYKAGLLNITDRLAAETQWYQEKVYQLETTISQRKAAMEAIQSAKHLYQSINVNP